jgi:hypothetical protein
MAPSLKQAIFVVLALLCFTAAMPVLPPSSNSDHDLGCICESDGFVCNCIAHSDPPVQSHYHGYGAELKDFNKHPIPMPTAKDRQTHETHTVSAIEADRFIPTPTLTRRDRPPVSGAVESSSFLTWETSRSFSASASASPLCFKEGDFKDHDCHEPGYWEDDWDDGPAAGQFRRRELADDIPAPTEGAIPIMKHHRKQQGGKSPDSAREREQTIRHNIDEDHLPLEDYSASFFGSCESKLKLLSEQDDKIAGLCSDISTANPSVEEPLKALSALFDGLDTMRNENNLTCPQQMNDIKGAIDTLFQEYPALDKVLDDHPNFQSLLKNLSPVNRPLVFPSLFCASPLCLAERDGLSCAESLEVVKEEYKNQIKVCFGV